MTKKIQSTYERFIKSLSSQEKRDFDKEYKKLAFSEMLLAIMQEDEISVRQLAKEAGISPTIIQGMRSGTRKHVSMQSFFKVLKGLKCNFLVEHNGQIIPLDVVTSVKK